MKEASNNLANILVFQFYSSYIFTSLSRQLIDDKKFISV